MTFAPVIASLRRDLPGLAGIYVFGSQAAGAALADSDVDLAVLAAAPIAPALLAETRHRLAVMLRREVDLIDLSRASTILQMQVLRGGTLIDAADVHTVGLFELRALREYADLKFRRAGIEADIQQRGRVHAR